MKKKKSRVESVGVLLFQGVIDTFYLTVPYDKKNRVIPSSVVIFLLLLWAATLKYRVRVRRAETDEWRSAPEPPSPIPFQR